MYPGPHVRVVALEAAAVHHCTLVCFTSLYCVCVTVHRNLQCPTIHSSSRAGHPKRPRPPTPQTRVFPRGWRQQLHRIGVVVVVVVAVVVVIVEEVVAVVVVVVVVIPAVPVEVVVVRVRQRIRIQKLVAVATATTTTTTMTTVACGSLNQKRWRKNVSRCGAKCVRSQQSFERTDWVC